MTSEAVTILPAIVDVREHQSWEVTFADKVTVTVARNHDGQCYCARITQADCLVHECNEPGPCQVPKNWTAYWTVARQTIESQLGA